MAYKYGDPVIINGKNVGTAKFDAETGKPLTPETIQKDNLQTSGETSDFMKAIQDKLLGQSSLISSTNSNLESRLNEAISGIKTSSEATKANIESNYARERAFAETQAGYGIQNQLEGRSGFATQMVALRNLTETTDKNLKDLEQRKNELILQNDANAASKISELQFKALEFQQQANQQIFSNLLGLGQFGIQQAQEERAVQAASDERKKILGDLITNNPQAGINMSDTIESAYNKIGVNPNSPDVLLKKAQIDKIYADIKNGGTTNKSTEAERKSASIAQYSNAFVPGAKLADGTPIVDFNGYITPIAWKKAIQDAPSSGLTRNDFIKEFGYLLYADNEGNISKDYGLTPQELKLITG